MQVTKTSLSPTKVKLAISSDEQFLKTAKEYVLKKLSSSVKVAGFREGSAPSHIVEKNLDQSRLQSEFLDQAVNSLYGQVVEKEKLRPVSDPKVELKKFVPFTTLDFEVEVEVVGEIKLADYKRIKKSKPSPKVSDKDVNDVIKSLQARLAQRTDAKRAAKNGDEVIIDFKGVNDKNEAVGGAEGKDYPLILGSNAFIPGFEPNVVGLKTGEEKTFDITFPKDYGVSALAGTKVTFTVKVNKVRELKEHAVDDKFASKAGPFKTLTELRSDIKKQLTYERQNEADRAFENELMQEIADKSSVVIPKVLVDEQVIRGEQQEKQNLTYKGQTWQEHLDEEGVSEEQHRERNHKTAEESVKVGLILSEIAEREDIDVTPEELEIRIQILKGQYKDPAMQSELDKPENRRDVTSRLITEKTVTKLVDYATK